MTPEKSSDNVSLWVNYIFSQWISWKGCILVITDTEENAREMMKNEQNYEPKREVDKHEIVNGFQYSNYGDM